jgi:hypothetical protein
LGSCLSIDLFFSPIRLQVQPRSKLIARQFE